MKQIVDKLNKIAKKINENVELSDRDLIIDSLDSITKAYGGTPNDSTLIVDKLDDIYNNIGAAPTGNIEITENTAEPLDISQYATATVNVAGGGGDVTETYYFVYSDEYEVEEGDEGFGDVYLYGNIIPLMPDTFNLDIDNNTVTFNKVSENSYTSADNKYTLNITNNKDIILTVSLSDFPLGSYIEIGEYTITLTGHPNYLQIPAGTLMNVSVLGKLDNVVYYFAKNNPGDSDIIFTVISDYIKLGR